jgi:hypothetical protein
VECNMALAKIDSTASASSPHSAAVYSGCTAHLNPTTRNMKNLRPCVRPIMGFESGGAASTHIGDELTMVLHEDGSWKPMMLKDVLVVPQSRYRLFSLKKHLGNAPREAT